VAVALLKLVKGGAVGQVIPLSGERILLGRHPSCQIVLDNAAVSRHHAQILENHGTYYLEDLRSRNGTQLNDVSIEGRIELHDGDQIHLCDYVFTFVEASMTNIVVEGGGKKLPPGSRNRLTIREEDDEDDSPATPAPPSKAKDKDSGQDKPKKDGDSDSDSDGGAVLEGSSVITSLDADSVRTVRLSVRPEVKLRAIMEIGAALGKVLKMEEVLPQILDVLFKIFPQADWGNIVLRNPTTQRLVVRASQSRHQTEEDNVPVSMTIVKHAMNHRQAILSADAARDKRFETSESLMELQIRSVMCAPLLEQAGPALGVIQIATSSLAAPFSSDDLELLASVATQCALAVSNAALHESLLAQRDMDRELEFATQVQLGFLPSEPPKVPGYEFADCYEPAHRVSGDYYDYIRLPNGNVAIAVGDVAGKGVPAALLMARLNASARYHLLSATSASEAISSLNAEIMTSGLGFRFITLALVILDAQKHELRVANAGHLPPLLRSARGMVGPIGQKSSGMPLGISGTQSYQELAVPLEPNDTVLFYTDGVTEAMNPEQQIYGRERLMDVFAKGPQDAGKLVPHIMDDVERFYQSRAQRDDVCIVALRRLT
jgi:sigma-B regulation protein RsbU (phosphoserine phosphatase)